MRWCRDAEMEMEVLWCRVGAEVGRYRVQKSRCKDAEVQERWCRGTGHAWTGAEGQVQKCRGAE